MMTEPLQNKKKYWLNAFFVLFLFLKSCHHTMECVVITDDQIDNKHKKKKIEPNMKFFWEAMASIEKKKILSNFFL